MIISKLPTHHPDPIVIRLVILEDAQGICDIYNHYVEKSISTFETEPITAEAMTERIEQVIFGYKLPWFVYAVDEKILGYSYATKWKPRVAYSKTVETSIYIHPNHIGRGIGRQLYSATVEWLKELEFHSLLGGIALPNDASIELHEKLGFQKVGQLKEVGYKFDKWIDVGYWELVF